MGSTGNGVGTLIMQGVFLFWEISGMCMGVWNGLEWDEKHGIWVYGITDMDMGYMSMKG